MKKSRLICLFSLIGVLGVTTSFTNKAPLSVLHSSVKKVAVDTTPVTTTNVKTNLNGHAYFNSVLETLDQLKEYANADIRPTNLILNINENCELVDLNNKSLGITLKDAFDQYIKGKMLPVVNVKNETIGKALSTYLDTTFVTIDMAVQSNDFNLLKTIRSNGNGKKIRAIYDASGFDEKTKTNKDLIKETNIARANTIVLSEERSTLENVRYFLARFKCVWTNLNEFSELKAINLLTRGVYGINVKDVKKGFETFKHFSKTENPKRNVNRAPFNIGHRGMPNTNYENSLEGFVEAYQKGATHVEIDVHVTKDKQLVVMHDTSIDRTTTGKGVIKQLTADEIKQHKIIKNNSGITLGEGVKIPFLEDVLAEFKGKDCIIVLEIKCDDIDFSTLCRPLLEKYDMFDQVVAISFYNGQLKEFGKVNPEIPSATLNNFKEGMFNKTTSDGVATLNTGNFGLDLNLGLFTETFDNKMAERGFLGYYWTYDNKQNFYTGMNNGALGMTNNLAGLIENNATRLVTDPKGYEIFKDENYADAKFEVNYLTYGRKQSQEKLEAKPVFVEEHGDFAYAVLSAHYMGPEGTPRYRGVVFSDVVKITKKNVNKPTPTLPEEPVTPPKEDTPTKDNSNLGLIIGGTIGGVALVSTIAAGAFIYIKKKKK